MKYRNQLTATIVAMGLGTTGLAVAQDQNDADDSLVFEEVIVTATKREESIFDVPVAGGFPPLAPAASCPYPSGAAKATATVGVHSKRSDDVV